MSIDPFREFEFPSITADRFAAMRSEPGAKRIYFADTHKNALKSYSNGKANFTLPFKCGIERFLPIELYKSKFVGYWKNITDKSEYDRLRAWVDENKDLVFMKSLATSATAICSHVIDDDLSDVGKLEKAAKYDGDEAAREKLGTIVSGTFLRLFADQRIDYVVAVPPSKAGKFSLPSYVAKAVSEASGVEDISASVHWNGDKPPLKEASLAEKWAKLDEVGMTVPSLRGKNVVLIDDMYQSGATTHYVAGELRKAGADDIHILAISKSRRDTDNTG